jgi:hypothetical protein
MSEAEAHDIDERVPHWVGRAICLRCFRRWIAVQPAPDGCLLPPSNLVCPACGHTDVIAQAVTMAGDEA